MEIMRIFPIIVISLLLLYESGQCFVSLIPVAIGGVFQLVMYHFKECCTDDYILADFELLDKLLKENVYGQDLAHDTVLHALRSHRNTSKPDKALALSFHGLPGTGKNYVADFIIKALYKNGGKSDYVHTYKARLRFRSEELTEQYQSELQNEIIAHLKACPRSIFVFDEVDKFPARLLDILVPFLDFNPKIEGVEDPTQAIFIFLSNTGGTRIADYMLENWEDGKKREDASLPHLERILAVAAFNTRGGFHKSDNIEGSLIGHYVPFLPLEKRHVRQCAVASFRKKRC